MITGCYYDEAFDLFLDMVLCGVRPSAVTVVSLVQACGVCSRIPSRIWNGN